MALSARGKDINNKNGLRKDISLRLKGYVTSVVLSVPGVFLCTDSEEIKM
jgi:hypothetical protein